MKLRNKKTGEIREDSDLGKMLIRYAMPSYDSIAELCEEWEDYKPAEPLIKDEKIRKAVKAWADINNIDKVQYNSYYSDGDCSFVFTYKGDEELLLDFKCMVDNLVGGKYYTIAELCGEEEE